MIIKETLKVAEAFELQEEDRGGDETMIAVLAEKSRIMERFCLLLF